MFEQDVSYTREEIHTEVGGSMQSFLPHVGGRVVAACLRRDYNPDAPAVVLVGTGEGIEQAADMLVAQRSPVPTFIKQGTDGWEYVGEFAAERSSQDATDLAAQARRSGREDITRVIYMVLSPAQLQGKPKKDSAAQSSDIDRQQREMRPMSLNIPEIAKKLNELGHRTPSASCKKFANS